MNKIIVCYGTRPELIKLAPLIWRLKSSEFRGQLIVVNTNQHVDTMCEEALDIQPDYCLDVLTLGQNMSQLSAKVISRLDFLIQNLIKERQNLRAFIVQGDTITAQSCAQVAFLNKIPLYHVESGFRSDNIHSPFPEEFNRKVISLVAAMHFAPSETEKNNLLSEGVAAERIKVVGNTVNDILKHYYKEGHKQQKKIVLISIHRKSNQNENLNLLFDQVESLANQYPSMKFIWLRHPAPFINKTISNPNSKINIRSDVFYPEMAKLYETCSVVITDSGGIMEESAFLGIPRIIIREDNERIGLLDSPDTFLYTPLDRKLEDIFERALLTRGIRNYIYGNGFTAEKILDIIMKELKLMPTQAIEH